MPPRGADRRLSRDRRTPSSQVIFIPAENK